MTDEELEQLAALGALGEKAVAYIEELRTAADSAYQDGYDDGYDSGQEST